MLEEERPGRSRGRKECTPDVGEVAEARSRVDWPEEDGETARTVDELLELCEGLVAVPG